MGASCSMALLSQVSTSYPRVPRDSYNSSPTCRGRRILATFVKIAGFVSSRQSFSFYALYPIELSLWTVGHPDSNRRHQDPCLLENCCLWLIKSYFLLFSCALPTELCLPIRSVGLEPTCHVTEVFETSLYTYSSMTAYGTQIDQIHVPFVQKLRK